MTFDPLFERLQRALQPDYRLERLLASGGMGIVYVAHDVMLSREVAVKTIRPELATAHAAEAFLREARILASVNHPNAIAIYKVSEGEGLPFIIMELIAGETLAERLQAGGGPLTTEHAVKLGKNLLDCLAAVHHAGVVHRDVKPSNVFMLPSRDVLGDFGIARPPVEAQRASPRGGVSAIGTPGYMAPEQLSGGPITPQTDIYAAGAVIYEALTARRYPQLGEVAPPSWRGIPRPIARVLRRALRATPDERWPDARTFRRALWRAYVRRYVARTVMLTIGGLMVGAAMAWAALTWGPTPPMGTLTVALPRFEYTGPAPQRRIADSLHRLVRADLASHPDFLVKTGRRWLLSSKRSLVVRGHVVVADSQVRVELGGQPAALRASLRSWPALSDSLSYRILLAVWDSNSPLAPSLPVGALPRTTLGLARFLRAEQLVASAQWESAYDAYRLAESTDSTCWLCSWRLSEVERWLGREHDPARTRRYLDHVTAFPAGYASLIRAAQVPLKERLDTLEDVTARERKWFLGWFQVGDELFHRGPLAGRRRADAIVPFATAARLRPDFAPAWEHLAWVSIAEGDSAEAARALDSLDQRRTTRDPYALTLRALLGIGFAWRFLPSDQAEAITRQALADPVAGASPDLGAGPRMLGAFEAPHGQITFGRLLQANTARDLRRSGLIAEVLGLVAVGRPQEARERAHRLAEISPEMALFVSQLDAALGSVEGESKWQSSGPFVRTMTQLERSAQDAQRGDTAGARSELLWHEHTDLVGLPTGLPQAAEVDWAFGPLARWRLARLLDTGPARPEVCENYRAVARNWQNGEPRYKTRAEFARDRLDQLGCMPDA